MIIAASLVEKFDIDSRTQRRRYRLESVPSQGTATFSVPVPRTCIISGIQFHCSSTNINLSLRSWPEEAKDYRGPKELLRVEDINCEYSELPMQLLYTNQEQVQRKDLLYISLGNDSATPSGLTEIELDVTVN